MEREKIDSSAVKQECFRRAIEVGTQTITALANMKKHSDVKAVETDSLLKGIVETMEKANSNLQSELTEMK